MKALLLVVVGIVVGMSLALVGAIAVEAFSAVVHPFPADFDGSTEQVCAHVARYPQWVLAVVVPLWAGTGFGAVWAAKMLGRLGAAITVATLLFFGVTANVAMLPYPFWFKVTGVAGVLIALVAAARGRKQQSVAEKVEG